MKIKNLAIILIILLLVCPAFSQNITDEEDPFTCAIIAFNEGFFDISIEFLNRYFQKPEAKNNEYAHFLYAINLLKLKKYEESLLQFEQLSKLFPESKYSQDIWKYKISLHMLLDESLQAWNVYKNGIAEYGRDNEIEKNLGYMLLNDIGKLIQKGDYLLSKQILDDMEKIFTAADITNQINYYQAIILYQENNFDASVKKFLQIYPYFKGKKIEPEILLKIGDCFFNMKNYIESERYYDTLISKFPDSSQAEWAKLQKSLIFKRNMKYKEARKLLLSTIKTGINNQVLTACQWELAKLSELEDKKDEAVFWYKKIIETSSDSSMVLKAKLQMGYLYFNQKNYDKAIENFTQYLNSEKEPDVIYVLGLAYYNSDKHVQAINTWESLLSMNPEYPVSLQVLKAMYNFYKETDNKEMMRKIFNRIWETYPEDNFILTEGIIFINDLLNKGGVDIATDYLMKIESKKNQDVAFLKAKILYLTGKIDESEQLLKNIDKKSVFAAEALYLLVEISLAKSNLKDAQIYYVKLLSSFPKTIWAQKAKESLSRFKAR
ncbi:MAG: tetratricopeptide repeat protein [Candidatus Omnitrophica bacterium]|nr:tetratricopeptide repeat protein [Candidatus Omnitrophota bacterium]